MSKKNNRFLLFLAGLIISVQLYAQPKDNSPLSRFGLGDLVNQSFASTLGMGGISTGFASPYNINVLNPASLGSLQLTAFELGLYAKYKNTTFNKESVNLWNGNLNYLALGFPLKNPISEELERKKSPWKFGMAFSIVPYTEINYNIETIVGEPEIDTTKNTFQGTGGTYKFLWGNAVKYKNFSFGVNAGYLFGNLKQERRKYFLQQIAVYNDYFDDNISIRGFIWNAGMMYKFVFKNNKNPKTPSTKSLTIGISGNSSTKFATKSTRLYYSQNLVYGDRDTTVFEQDKKDTGKLPPEFSAGFIYEDLNKFKFGADFSSSFWEKYENGAKPESLKNSTRISFGAEFIPDITSYNNFFKRVRYRIGGYYGTDPRSFNEDLTYAGITIGAGFPIILTRQRLSFVNAAFEFGKFGNPDFIKENFIKFTLGFTLNDNSWFFKRKFN